MDGDPSYMALYRTGELRRRVTALERLLASCTLCPRDCRVNRAGGELGLCKAGHQLMLAAAFPHFGEEPPLSGQQGSGAIFISWCNLLCQFCQSWEVNHRGEGVPVSAQELAEIMVDLQSQGCHNINFVTPTHYAPQLIAALPWAIEQGFRLPLVYNCGGYESLEVIQLLDGIVDIYLPDIKFLDPLASERYLDGAADYPEVVRAVLKEMYRQVGNLELDAHGIARRGLLVRHLVMPGMTQDSHAVLRFIADELSPQTYVNLMDQYRPCFQAGRSPEIARRTTAAEHRAVVEMAHRLGLHRGIAVS
ncbi:MAG TPA: radical SAM protein [Candidatus Tectomicrobia bacterium]|nr:radical SAM protein [Candidatus Tectomicrobia bacterium]